jgi:hypothetical protein
VASLGQVSPECQIGNSGVNATPKKHLSRNRGASPWSPNLSSGKRSKLERPGQTGDPSTTAADRTGRSTRPDGNAARTVATGAGGALFSPRPWPDWSGKPVETMPRPGREASRRRPGGHSIHKTIMEQHLWPPPSSGRRARCRLRDPTTNVRAPDRTRASARLRPPARSAPQLPSGRGEPSAVPPEVRGRGGRRRPPRRLFRL